MDSIYNFYNSFHKPVDDDFYRKGYLTHEQFVESGDSLTKTGWRWKKDDVSKEYLECKGSSMLRIKAISGMREVRNEEGFI